ncbi:MAG: aminotransferase class III-fold pyridoxal phosphate-dependent enzyme, partial [Acidimicrobiia bacterium]
LETLPGVEAVRGTGLLLAAELGTAGDAKAVEQACRERGLIVNAVTPTALRLAPPLLVSDDEVDEALAILRAALDAGSGS